VLVRDQVPQNNRADNALHIGVVFGQRSQLYWDLPVSDVFTLYRKMYRVEPARFRRNVAFYTELLEMGEFLTRPIRQLSLGQKMRAELAVTMLHDPEILYLDEPTIGLDVVAKGRIRTFIREVNQERRTTVILTTHDMDDIEQICDRLIMIDQGRLLYDGQLAAFKQQFAGESMIIFTHDINGGDEIEPDLGPLHIVRQESGKKWVLFDPRQICTAEAVRLLMQHYPLLDFSLKEPGIEDILRNIYQH
jgi:ABC-2 type transport system ATP-binding protein